MLLNDLYGTPPSADLPGAVELDDIVTVELDDTLAAELHRTGAAEVDDTLAVEVDDTIAVPLDDTVSDFSPVELESTLAVFASVLPSDNGLTSRLPSPLSVIVSFSLQIGEITSSSVGPVATLFGTCCLVSGVSFEALSCLCVDTCCIRVL